ncbi:hypothetical protein [Pedobacter sp. NJ-S-72]
MPAEYTSLKIDTPKKSSSINENAGTKGLQLPAVPIQFVVIPDLGKKPLPNEEVWEEVKFYMEELPVSKDHEQWMKTYLESREMKNKSFDTYEDVGDFLLEKVNAKFGTSYQISDDDNEDEDEDAQEKQMPKKSLLSAGMVGLVKYLAIFSAVQAIGGSIPGAEAHTLPPSPGMKPLPGVCPPLSGFGNSSIVPVSLPMCPLPEVIPSPSLNVGSLANLIPFQRILTTDSGAGLVRNSSAYSDKIGLGKPAEDRSIAPEEVDYLQGASSEEFIGRFTPYALAILKSNRVAQTEKANAMSHFNTRLI